MKVLISILIFAVFLNTAIHFFFAPYREYKTNFEVLRNLIVQSNNNLRREVREQMIPYFTNQISIIERRSVNSILSTIPNSPVVSASQVSEDSIDFSKDVFNPFSVNAFTFFANNQWAIYDSPFTFYSGDETSSGLITKIWKGGFSIGDKRFMLSGRSSVVARSVAIEERPERNSTSRIKERSSKIDLEGDR